MKRVLRLHKKKRVTENYKKRFHTSIPSIQEDINSNFCDNSYRFMSNRSGIFLSHVLCLTSHS